MPTPLVLGELEQQLLLVLLRLGDGALAVDARAELSRLASRRVTRGALYRTLDRLERKGFVAWELEGEPPAAGGHPRRRFRVTGEGIAALRASRRLLTELWRGHEEVLS